MTIEVGRMSQGIQIGRTVVAFELRKDSGKDHHGNINNTHKNLNSISKDKKLKWVQISK